ncbi:MAG: efflux RND transporter permease subunit [Phycisphaerales bacterium]
MSIPRFGMTRPVPVNLLMAAILIGGVASAITLTREFFPDTTPDSALVTLPYPGASPAEVEEGMARKVEDALADLDEVERLTTTLAEGGGGITVEFRSDLDDVDKAVDEVERAIDTLRDLPDEAEQIDVHEFEPRMPTIMVTLFGDAEEEALKRAIRHIRDDLNSLRGMGQIVMSGVRDYEIRIDVSPAALLEHRLSLPQVADQIRLWMVDVPGGSVRTGVGDISVRTMGVPEQAQEIRQIVVKASPQGQVLRVGDIADVREYYVDEQLITRFNGRSSVSLTVYKTGDQDAVKIAQMARAYVAGVRFAAGQSDSTFETQLNDRVLGVLNSFTADSSSSNPAAERFKTNRRSAYELGLRSPNLIPAGCDVQTHSDLARFIEGRLDLLVRNARWGALLVFATLLLFLNWRVALWVGLGLVIALSGALIVMQIVGITLNLLTMFGMIVVLGLLVDDAIVVAENIQARYDRQEPALVAAIKGAEQVFWPVVATVLTSIVAFLPLRFIQGQIGDLIGALPVVVSCALAFSLVEAVLILPSHMGHSLLRRDRTRPGRFAQRIRRFEVARDHLIMDRIVPSYARLLAFLLRYRYATLAAALAALIASVGMVAGGRAEFTFIGESDSETIIIDLRMPVGTAIERTDQVVQGIEAAARAEPEVKSVSTLIGASVDLDTGRDSGAGGHLAQLFVELTAIDDDQRERESSEVIASIRNGIGVINDVERLRFIEIQGGFSGPDITIIVTGPDEADLQEAVAAVRSLLGHYKGVYDIADDNARGQREVQVNLKPGAAPLGLTVADVAAQVRGALYGLEPHVYSDQREDIKVRVRLAEKSRRSLYAIENMYIITPDGGRVPLAEVAEVIEATSHSVIHRVNRNRAVTIIADTAPDVPAEPILAALQPDFDRLQVEFPGLGIELGGTQRQMTKAFSTLPIGFAAASVLIYIILAWLFGSYLQPLAVMLAIPFSIIGVIWGHLLLGYQITFLSLIGFVALSGVVVNDSLILVDFYNTRRKEGLNLREALIDAGRHRLRPIFLTTITTILGLTPLMLETSFQAHFLIPMAVSISAGLMSATVLILVVLPCILVIIDDFKAVAFYLWHGQPRPESGPVEVPSLDALSE